MSDDDKVGYGRPPRHSRFRKGQSGNPRGRPKGARNFVTELQEALDQPMLIREGGRTRRVTRRGAVALSVVDRALKGNMRAVSLMAGLEQRADASRQGGVDDTTLSTDEAEVLDGFKARVRDEVRRALEPEGSDEEPGS